MPNCVNYNCTDLGEHTPNDCGAIVLGGVPQIIILSCDHAITDPSNQTQVNAALANGTARLVENVKVGINLPSAIKTDSFVSNRPQTLLNYDRSGTLIDGNVSEANNEFYRELFVGTMFGGLIIYEEDEDQITWIDEAISFTGGRTIPNNNGEGQRYEGTFEWKSKYEPAIYAAPVGVFS